jgi:hypothetical protein
MERPISGQLLAHHLGAYLGMAPGPSLGCARAPESSRP